MKWLSFFLIFLLGFMIVPPFIPSVKANPDSEAEADSGMISYQPNVVPSLVITDCPVDKPESFRFEWFGNRFDIELFFNATYEQKGVNVTKLWSLRDFEVDFNVTVQYVVNKNESRVQFGWLIENVENVSEFVHNAWFKIEDTRPFDYEDIELEIIDLNGIETFSQLKLPDNLRLSFDDLKHKGFVIGWQNKTVTSVKGFSGKSSWNLDPVAYGGGVITITGYSEGSECDADDIVSGVGNVSIFAKHDDLQYSIGEAVIVIGDDENASWAAFENIQLAFNSTCISSDWTNPLIKVENYGHLRLGKLINSDNKRTEDGVAILNHEDNRARIIDSDRYSEVNLYSSYFWSYFGEAIIINCDSTYSSQIYECIFDQAYLQSGVTYVDADIYRITQKKTDYGFRYFSATINDAYFHSDVYALYWHGSYAPYTVTNLKARNCTKLMQTYSLGAGDDSYLINADVDSWTFAWAGTNTAEIYRQYTFDLTVQFPNGTAIQNANVTISNDYLGSSDSWLTYANGSIPQQTYSYGHYNQTGGNSLYDYNPYNLTVTYPDYQTYTALFNITEKTDWTITLTEETGGEGGYLYFAPAFLLAFILCLALMIVWIKK